MSDYGIFESVSTDGLEEETRLRSAQRSFDRAVFAAKEEFGVFLGAAESRADFDNRLALVKRDLIATIHAAGIDPVTGVVRKIAKTMRPDFSKKASRRTAGDPGNPQVTGTPPVGSCPSCGLSTGWTGTECAMCGYREASRTAGSEWGEGFEDGPTGLDRDDEDDSGSDEAEDDPSWKSSGRKVSQRKSAFAPGDKVVDTAWGGLLDDQPGTVVSVDGDQVTVDWSPHGIQETHPASELRQAYSDGPTASRKTAAEQWSEVKPGHWTAGDDLGLWGHVYERDGQWYWEVLDSSTANEDIVASNVASSQQEAQAAAEAIMDDPSSAPPQVTFIGKNKTAEESREEKAVDLVNEGDWEGYLKEVAPDAMESAEKNFEPGDKSKESGKRTASVESLAEDFFNKYQYGPVNLSQIRNYLAYVDEEIDLEEFLVAIMIEGVEVSDLHNAATEDPARKESGRKQAISDSTEWEEYDPDNPDDAGWAEMDQWLTQMQTDPARGQEQRDWERQQTDTYNQNAYDEFRDVPVRAKRKRSAVTVTADDWKYDQAFQKFLLDLYGTTHGLTEDEIIEALEAYAGVGRPAEVIGTDPVAPTPPVPVGLASREKTAAPEWSLWPGGAGEWTGLETSDGKYMAEVHLYGDAGPSGGMGTGAVEWTISEIGPGSFDFKEVERSTKEYYKVPEAQADATEALKKYGPVGA